MPSTFRGILPNGRVRAHGSEDMDEVPRFLYENESLQGEEEFPGNILRVRQGPNLLSRKY